MYDVEMVFIVSLSHNSMSVASLQVTLCVCFCNGVAIKKED